MFLAFCYYGWISVAAFYSQLKDKETDEEYAEDYTQEGRSEIFIRPPPPPYTISYENPLAYEKPPPYEEGTNRYWQPLPHHHLTTEKKTSLWLWFIIFIINTLVKFYIYKWNEIHK